MKKQNLKTNKGITLIALVITIVVLLILTMVSIRLVLNGGIITHAENATNQYKVAQEKEKIALGYSEYKMEKYTNPNAVLSVDGATVTENGQNGWKVEFERGNSYDLNVDGEISAVEPYVPVVNSNPTEWTIAYSYDGTNWTKYTEEDQVAGGSAEGGIVTGQIVAKFYKQNVSISAGEINLPDGSTIPAPAKDYSYKLYIEGTETGEMPIMLDLSSGTGYGYDECFGNAIQTGNGENLLIPYVTEIKVCEGVTNIGGFAFSNAINLEKVQIAKTVKTIGTSAFIFCTNLTEIEIPYGIEKIEESTFAHSSLISVKLPNSLKEIGEYAFTRCNSLLKIVIPNSVRKIGEYAFSNCSMLKEAYIYTETCEFDGHYHFEFMYSSREENAEKGKIYLKNPDFANIIGSGDNYVFVTMK